MIGDITETPLQMLPSFPQDDLPAFAPNSAARLVQDRTNRLALFLGITAWGMRVSDNDAHVSLLQAADLIHPKIAFVGGEAPQECLLVGIVANRTKNFVCVHHPLGQIHRVPIISLANSRHDDGSTFQIIDVSGVVNHVASPLFR
jgi:hypothetical protein